MNCDGRHVKALKDVLDRMAAAVEAHRQLGGRLDHGLDSAIGNIQAEHAEAKAAMAPCSDCSAVWATFLKS